MILRLLYKLGFGKYIDYRISGEYYEAAGDGIHYTRKFYKEYFIKRNK